MTIGVYLLECLNALALIFLAYGPVLVRWNARQKGIRRD